jgi:hypothetical protein
VALVVASLAFAVAVACAALMGFAIQRGATCTVAAVEEIVAERRATRLLALLEAAFWVGGALLVAAALGLLPALPAGYPIGARTIAGGVLLGLGAFVNGACVFGAVARFGSGEWAYIVTPLGFFAGCLSLGAVFGSQAPPPLPYGSPVLHASAWAAALFVAFVAWRIARSLFRLDRTANGWRAAWARRVWSPHVATLVIGMTFFVMLLVAGSWAYTDVLIELARGMASGVGARSLLLLALLAGAIVGGWTAGRLRSGTLTALGAMRCFAGGVLMGWGSLLVPGGNDGLVLLGMPLAWPYAWVAFATMCLTIAAAQVATHRGSTPSAKAKVR